MSRPSEGVRAELLALLPPGWAWRRDAASNHGRALLASARELARVEASAEAMLPEADPRTADRLLDDYERVLGPDACGRDQLALTLTTRRQLAHQRWTGRGGASIGYLHRLAQSLDVELQIQELRPTYAGEMQAGDELIPEASRFAWIATLPATRPVEFEAGASEAGDLLVDYEPTLMECLIRRLAPAHTLPIIVYREDP